MSLFNFRLFETQARWAIYLTILAGLMLGGLTFLVFKGFNWENRILLWDPNAPGLAKHRERLVFLLTGLAIVTSVIAASMGYSSLGEPRNPRQRASWAGMLLGCMIVCIAVLDAFVWRSFAQTVLK